MKLQPFKTRLFKAYESLEDFLDEVFVLSTNHSWSGSGVLAITSKIVALAQGRVVEIPKDETRALELKEELVAQEADLFLPASASHYNISLALRDGLLMPAAGIDASNAENNVFILPPDNPQKVARDLWHYLNHHPKRQSTKNEIGVLITDSHTTPLRRGVTGIALGWCGFAPLKNYVGQDDLFGRPLRFTFTNVIDALSTSAVFMMGEGREQIPLVFIENPPHVSFQDRPPTPEEESLVKIPLYEDIYGPFFENVSWQKGSRRSS